MPEKDNPCDIPAKKTFEKVHFGEKESSQEENVPIRTESIDEDTTLTLVIPDLISENGKEITILI